MVSSAFASCGLSPPRRDSNIRPSTFSSLFFTKHRLLGSSSSSTCSHQRAQSSTSRNTCSTSAHGRDCENHRQKRTFRLRLRCIPGLSGPCVAVCTCRSIIIRHGFPPLNSVENQSTPWALRPAHQRAMGDGDPISSSPCTVARYRRITAQVTQHSGRSAQCEHVFWRQSQLHFRHSAQEEAGGWAGAHQTYINKPPSGLGSIPTSPPPPAPSRSIYTRVRPCSRRRTSLRIAPRTSGVPGQRREASGPLP